MSLPDGPTIYDEDGVLRIKWASASGPAAMYPIHGALIVDWVQQLNDLRAQLAGISDALASAHSTMAFSSADHGAEQDRAWLYGLFCGWDCDDHLRNPEHVHNEDCDSAMPEVAERFSWSAEAVEQLRAMHEAVVTVEGPGRRVAHAGGGLTVVVVPAAKPAARG